MALQVIFTYTLVISFSIYSLPRLFCGTVIQFRTSTSHNT